MRNGRSFTLPIDPWPNSSWAERTGVSFLLVIVLIPSLLALGAVALIVGVAVRHAYRSYDLGAALRGAIDRRLGLAPPWAPVSGSPGRGRPAVVPSPRAVQG